MVGTVLRKDSKQERHMIVMNEAMREIIIKEGYSIWNLAKEGTEHDRTIKKALRISALVL